VLNQNVFSWVCCAFVCLLVLTAPCTAQCTGSLLWEHAERGAETSIALSPEGNYVTTGSSKGITVFDTNGTIARDIQVRGDHGIAMSAGGQSLAAGGSGLNVYAPDGSVQWKWSNGYFVFDVDIDPDGSEVVACSDDAAIRSFNLTNGIAWNVTFEEDIFSIARSADGGYIACGSKDGHIYLLNRDQRQVWNYRTGGALIGDIAISSDGARIAALSEDGMLYYLSRSGRMLWSKSIGRSNQVATADDGSIVAAGGDTISVYSADGERIWSHDTGTKVSGIDLSADGSLLAASDRDRIYVFSLDCKDNATAATQPPVEGEVDNEPPVTAEPLTTPQKPSTTPAKSGADHIILGTFSLFCLMMVRKRN
jgi:WD40 repeat protein